MEKTPKGPTKVDPERVEFVAKLLRVGLAGFGLTFLAALDDGEAEWIGDYFTFAPFAFVLALVGYEVYRRFRGLAEMIKRDWRP